MFYIEKNGKILGSSSNIITPQKGERVFRYDFTKSERSLIENGATVNLVSNGKEEFIVQKNPDTKDDKGNTVKVPDETIEIDSYLVTITESLESKEKEKLQKIQALKDKCRKDILARYSETDQMNMTANVARINAVAKREKRDFTTEENAKLDAADAMFAFVHARLEKSKAEIAKIHNTSI